MRDRSNVGLRIGRVPWRWILDSLNTSQQLHKHKLGIVRSIPLDLAVAQL